MHGLNAHCASISNILIHFTNSLPHSASPESITEWRRFQILDTLRPTSTGLDQLPAGFSDWVHHSLQTFDTSVYCVPN